MSNNLVEEGLSDLVSSLNEEERDQRIEGLIDEIEALDHLLVPEAQHLIHGLRPHLVSDDVYEEIDRKDDFGDRVADQLARLAGSWRFIMFFAVFMGTWIAINFTLAPHAFDPFPFILLNLGLSTLAALQAPVILMAQNRQSEKDRAMADNDYQVNIKNEIEIADLHRKIDNLAETLIMQRQMLNALVAGRRQELSARVQSIENGRKNDQFTAK